MSYTHHQVNSTADIPSDYYQLTRSVLENHDPLNPRYEARPNQPAPLDDFMTGEKEGDVHELWRQDRFMTNCIQQIRDDNIYTRSPLDSVTYKRITPALRLATVMLERSMDLWLLIMYARENYDYVKMDKWLDEANFNIKGYHHNEFTTVDLPRLTRMTIIGYDKTCEPHQFGTTTAIWAVATPNQTPQLKIGMGYNVSVLEPFTTPSQSDWDNTSHAEKCRSWVHLALTLVHEFAHALQMYRHRDTLRQRAIDTNASPDSHREPRILSVYDGPELGRVFEIKTFGGVMDMPEEEHAWRNCSRSTIFDYDNMLDIPQIMTPGTSGEFDKHADISPDTIIQFMQEKTWTNNKALDMYIWQHR